MAFVNSTDEFKQYVYTQVGNEYKVLGEFSGTTKKIGIIHNNCYDGETYSYEVTPEKFKAGRRCPHCAIMIRSKKIHKKTTKTTEQFKKEVFDLVGDEYIVIGSYINKNEKIKMLHSVCGTEYDVSLNHFLRGNRCKYCYNKSRTKTQEQFEKEVLDILGKEYKVLGQYNKNDEEIELFHTVCNHHIFIRPVDIITHGIGCRYCNESHGERKIRLLLEESGINFDRFVKFEECKNKYYLEFDFQVYKPDLEKDNKFVLIEFDGRLHFEPYTKNNPEHLEKLKKQQRNDELKNEFCKKYDIELIRIPYTDMDNIEKILKEHKIL
jgi:hypothetical protein